MLLNLPAKERKSLKISSICRYWYWENFWRKMEIGEYDGKIWISMEYWMYWCHSFILLLTFDVDLYDIFASRKKTQLIYFYREKKKRQSM